MGIIIAFSKRLLLQVLYLGITNCEGYSGIRIRTDDPYTVSLNVASGGAHYIYIVWLYKPRTPETIQLIPYNTPVLNLILMNPMIL